MAELVIRIDDRTGEPVTENRPSLSEFRYENGYVFCGTDLGGLGVKIELLHKEKEEGGGAIILPPGKARECAKWLLTTLGQTHPHLPKELPEILKKIIKRKEATRILERGDKKKIRDALRLLKN
ncbi:MAG: hypothetical protein ACYTEQ_08980 [Planctomycetota bacterium]|jgi:hypothetical protein